MDIVLVQASRVLPDADVIAAIPSLTKWAKLVTDSYALPECHVSFMQLQDYLAGKAGPASPNLAPLFINKHSTDPGALGFHDTDNAGIPYGRTFAGDDLLDRVSPWTTMAHEVGEVLNNPFVKKIVTLRNGDLTPEEIADAVEDDSQAIIIDNYAWSNFVFPNYWEDKVAYPPGTKFDYQGRLRGPAPTLTPGGYLSIYPPGGPSWTQITAMHLGTRARPSARSARFHGSLRHRQLVAAVPAP